MCSVSDQTRDPLLAPPCLTQARRSSRAGEGRVQHQSRMGCTGDDTSGGRYRPASASSAAKKGEGEGRAPSPSEPTRRPGRQVAGTSWRAAAGARAVLLEFERTLEADQAESEAVSSAGALNFYRRQSKPTPVREFRAQHPPGIDDSCAPLWAVWRGCSDRGSRLGPAEIPPHQGCPPESSGFSLPKMWSSSCDPILAVASHVLCGLP